MLKNKERKKETKDRGNRKYGQAKLKHSKKGMSSCVCALGIGMLLVLLIFSAYAKRGNSPIYTGALGIGGFIFSCVGVNIGIKGMREREKNYITCRVGIGMNVFYILCFFLLFLRGLM
ncbi:MAG: DUF6142 family protein [Lachnospiraceae bacterium]